MIPLSTASAVLDSIFMMCLFLLFLSSIVRNAELVPEHPRTVSISQCPNSSRLSTSSGLNSILIPYTFMFFLTCSFFTLLLTRSGRSMFLYLINLDLYNYTEFWYKHFHQILYLFFLCRISNPETFFLSAFFLPHILQRNMLSSV